jgi:diguanylate cyclase (GGDEF)-like protein
MFKRSAVLGTLMLGASDRQRMRVSQSLLGVPSLLMMQVLLLVEWQLGRAGGAAVAWYIGLTLAGCVVFYVLVRHGLGERLSSEPSLSAPQMVYAMGCTAWAYALAGPLRSALLCLMPLILCFGIFALKPRSARSLSYFGITLMGAVMAWLVAVDPQGHEPLHEAANWVFVAASMAMIHVLSGRLGRMRARLNEQKAELTQALERIQLLATRDTLTGLLNRRAVQEELQNAVAHAQRHGRPLVVAMADLDHFKQINDSFGHQVGDRVLQAFARAAERELRSTDRVARWGGEEFLFMLPDTDEAQARICLDRLRVSYLHVPVAGVPRGHRLSFSAGVALCTSAAEIDAAIERADRALYSAKQAGRGRTHGLASAPAAVV